MATLHNLATELLILIQQALASPRDLHAFIAASPVALRVFSSNRAVIFTSVLINSIQPAALHHALAVCHVPVHLTHHPIHLRHRSQLEKAHPALESFLDQYFRGSLGFPGDIPRLRDLCRIQRLVSRFAEDYFRQTKGLLGPSSDNEAASTNPAPPSTTERVRLERAFFRYELYSRLFPVHPEVLVRSVFSGASQFGLFLGRLQPWEVEEMSCAHNYFTSLIRELIVALEDRLLRAVLTSAGIKVADGARPSLADAVAHGGPNNDSIPHRTNNSVPVNGPDNLDCHEELVPFADLELHGLSLHGAALRRDIPRFISKMASFGLEHMARLLDGDDGQKKDTLQKHAPFGRDFLPEALKHAPLLDFEHTAPAYAEENALDDDPRHPNLGYVRFNRKGRRLYHEIYDHSRDIAYSPLREMGYVFWDSARIKIPAVHNSLQEARDVSRATVSSRSWRKRMSVEERLAGVQIPRSQMRRIVREFGDSYSDDDGADEDDMIGSGSSGG